LAGNSICLALICRARERKRACATLPFSPFSGILTQALVSSRVSSINPFWATVSPLLLGFVEFGFRHPCGYLAHEGKTKHNTDDKYRQNLQLLGLLRGFLSRTTHPLSPQSLSPHGGCACPLLPCGGEAPHRRSCRQPETLRPPAGPR